MIYPVLVFLFLGVTTIGCGGTGTKNEQTTPASDPKATKMQKCENVVREHIKCLREIYDQTDQKTAWIDCERETILSVQHHVLQPKPQGKLKEIFQIFDAIDGTVDSSLEKLLDENKLSPEGELVISGNCAGQKKNGELFVCRMEKEMFQVCSDYSNF